MKHYFYCCILVVFMLSVTVVACNSSSSNTVSKQNKAASTTAISEEKEDLLDLVDELDALANADAEGEELLAIADESEIVEAKKATPSTTKTASSVAVHNATSTRTETPKVEKPKAEKKPVPPKKSKQTAPPKPKKTSPPPAPKKAAANLPAAPAPRAKPQPPKRSSANIAFDKTTHEFGTILMGDLVKHTFTFTNTGTTPLIINDAQSNCGCTIPEYSSTPIMPGERGDINVSFDTKGKIGVQSKEVKIYANTMPAVHTILLKGLVLTENMMPKKTPEPEPELIPVSDRPATMPSSMDMETEMDMDMNDAPSNVEEENIIEQKLQMPSQQQNTQPQQPEKGKPIIITLPKKDDN